MLFNNGNWQQTSTQPNFINIQAINSQVAVIKRNSITLHNDDLVQLDVIDKYTIDGADLTPSFFMIFLR